MSKGKNKKPDHLKANENPRNGVQTNDTLSVVDMGHDFVKSGETPKISNRTV